MNPLTLDLWIRSRNPEVPPPFLPFLLDRGGEPFGGSLQLEASGVREIRQALGEKGGTREAAFHLLAGDAFLTYACEALARSQDPGSGLSLFLERLGRQFR